MPAFCARVERFMILFPNTPSRRARTRSFLAIVISFMNDPIHFGLGSPMTWLSESLQLPPLIAARWVALPMSAV